MVANTYHTQTGKFLAQVATCMPEIPADIMQGWIQNPQALTKALTGALLPAEQASAVPSTPFEAKIWRTITLGTQKTPKEYRKALEKAKFPIGDWANQILDKITVASEPREVDLVSITVGEMGFPNGARRDAIYERAISMGFELCPNEVGPALRLSYTDQPKDEWLRVGMEPLTDSDGDLKLFGVGHDSDERWLYSIFGSPDVVWGADGRWLFVLPRK